MWRQGRRQQRRTAYPTRHDYGPGPFAQGRREEIGRGSPTAGSLLDMLNGKIKGARPPSLSLSPYLKGMPGPRPPL
jgi:hypothetical protein